MQQQTACLTGHRHMTAEERVTVRAQLERTLCTLIEEGVTYFGVGGAIGFDLLAAQTILSLKDRYEAVRLIVVLACRDQAARWHAADAATLADVCVRADKVVCLQDTYTPECMKTRDRYLVDHSGVCVCWLTHYGGGTGYTEQYALKNGKRVVHVVTDVDGK